MDIFLNLFGKKNITSITITVAVIVMLLLFFSCVEEKKEVVQVAFNPDSTFTMRATDVSTLISDSGFTRYRLNTKEWLVFGKAKDPFWLFPKGVYVEKFDTTFHTEASIEADTAYYWEKKGLWKLIGHVNVNSLQGENFKTELLYWDQKTEKVYSDKKTRIQKKDKIIIGNVGFEADQNLSKYKIFESAGVFPVKDSIKKEDQGKEKSSTLSSELVTSRKQVQKPKEKSKQKEKGPKKERELRKNNILEEY